MELCDEFVQSLAWISSLHESLSDEESPISDVTQFLYSLSVRYAAFADETDVLRQEA